MRLVLVPIKPFDLNQSLNEFTEQLLYSNNAAVDENDTSQTEDFGRLTPRRGYTLVCYALSGCDKVWGESPQNWCKYMQWLKLGKKKKNVLAYIGMWAMICIFYVDYRLAYTYRTYIYTHTHIYIYIYLYIYIYIYYTSCLPASV